MHVHALLKEAFNNDEAASQWFSRCQDVFCWSQYFDGQKRTNVVDNTANGVLEHKVSELTLNGHQ